MSKQKQFCEHVLQIIVNTGKSSEIHKQFSATSVFGFPLKRKTLSVWWRFAPYPEKNRKKLPRKRDSTGGRGQKANRYPTFFVGKETQIPEHSAFSYGHEHVNA